MQVSNPGVAHFYSRREFSISVDLSEGVLSDIGEFLVVFLRATERLAHQKNLCVHVMTLSMLCDC